MFNWLKRRRARREIEGMFGPYISSEKVKELVLQLDKPTAATERKIAVIMVNLVGYVGLAERLPLSKLRLVMNAYYDICGEAIHSAGGTLDKFIADGVVAYFNFPQRLENEAQAACDAALAIVRRADDFGRVCAEHGVEPCRFSIGIAVGPAIIGNMGSGSRLHFTPLGDVMGVAARNERAAKESGRLIVADRYCAEHAAQCRFEPLGESHFSLVPPPV